MNLDIQTMVDLEIFSDSQGGPGLFGHIDSTRTLQGRKALQARLSQPPVDSIEIVNIQRALEFLRHNPVPLPIDAELMNTVERYLGSRLEVSAGSGFVSTLKAYVSAARYRDVMLEISRGVAASVEFVIRIRQFCHQILFRDPGHYLTHLLSSAINASEILMTFNLGGGGRRSLWKTLESDKVFRSHRQDQMRHLVNVVADIDALMSMAGFGVELGYSLPEVSNNGLLFEAEGLVHPLLSNPVGNPVRLDAAQNVIYLTGPNMAGKTIFLKSIGISLFLAQLGMLVPANRLNFSPVQHLFTGMNTSDNLSSGISFYLAEVRRMKKAAQHLAGGNRALMLFDEIFKGTNVIDASEATRLVIESCAEIKGSMFVFASHLSGLSKVLGERGVPQRSFQGKMSGGKPSFSYQIHLEASDQRMGLHLLKQEGVVKLLEKAGNQSVLNEIT